MDFINQENHDDHDVSWTTHSSLHNTLVCLGCIVETIENTELLPLQRKPALTEFHTLLTHQSTELLQLFMKEERIVWHVVTILLESLNTDEESYLALSINVLLKMVQVIRSEDLVTAILDAVVKQVEITTDHKKLLPHYTLLGKLLFQLPALANTLLKQYDWLLNESSLDLCKIDETVQSSIAYVFIFLCDENQEVKLPARTLQQVHSGILTMLSSARSLPVLVNGLGLLKKLLADNAACQNLMTLTQEGVTLLTCLKKLLLSKKDVLQTAVSQILTIILKKENYLAYATTILESDIVEFLFESLNTENTVQIECILKVLQRLSNVEQFYKRCHSVYGVESVLRALSTSIELKNPILLSHSYSLLTGILNRHPEDIPLFLSSNVVQKCLSLIQHGLGHHQNSVTHTAQDAFSAILRKKYLLLPVPFQELTEMFSMVTKRKMDHLRSFRSLSDTRQAKNTETLIGSLERYLDLSVKACKLLYLCRDDLTSCESNFAAPGSNDGPSPMETFSELMFDVGHNICDVLMEKSADRFQNPQLYVKILQLLCSLNDLDIEKSCDLVHQLILAGFLVSLINVMAKFNSAQLTSLTDQFIKMVVECCYRRDMLPADGHLMEVLNVHHFKWPFSSLVQVLLDGNVVIDVIEAYLVVIYLACKYGNSGTRQQGWSDIICSVLNGHTTLEQFSAFGRKLYIYLLSYASTYEGTCVRKAVPNGLEGLPTILNGPHSEWYTHDISMLEWVLKDPVLSATSALDVVKAFFDNTSFDMMQEILETEGFYECDTLLSLCTDKTFLSALVTSMADNSPDNVTKMSLLLELYIANKKDHNSSNNAETGIEIEEELSVQESGTEQLEFLFDTTTQVLQNVFLKNYTQSQDHNIVGLLELMLVLMKYTQSAYSISVKILYHVLNVLSKKGKSHEDIERACMLTVLAAVTSKSDTQSQTSICAIVIQHEGFMGYLQQCIDRDLSDVMYCISCDLLVVIIEAKLSKCGCPIKLDILKIVNSVCMDTNDCQVASINLLSALLAVNMSSAVVDVTGRIYPSLYRNLYIQLQQACLKEVSGSAYSAVTCMRNLVMYLYRSDNDLGDELLSQPWNTVLLETVLDLASSGDVMEHQLCILSMLTEFETSCQIIKLTPNLLKKLMKFVQLCSKNKDKALREQYIILKKQLLRNFEGEILEDDMNLLKEDGM